MQLPEVMQDTADNRERLTDHNTTNAISQLRILVPGVIDQRQAPVRTVVTSPG
jgi:hypothetical protein